MDLFFSRDCADGAGPAVEAASPLCAAFAPAVPLVAPNVGVGCDSASGFDAGASFPAGLLNRLGVVLEVVVLAPVVAGAAEAPPPSPLPKPEKSDVPDDAVDVGAPAVAVVVAPAVAVVLAEAAGLPKLKPPPDEAGVELAAVENRLLGAPAEEAVVPVFPPRLNVGAPVDVGCEDVGCADDVDPRVNPEGFAVVAGVVLPSPPKRLPAGLGVCASCPPDAAVWFPPPNRFDVGVADGVALLFASVEAPVFPPRLRPPRGFAADCPAVAPPNRLGVEDDVVAGFAPPNRDDPPPLVWLLC